MQRMASVQGGRSGAQGWWYAQKRGWPASLVIGQLLTTDSLTLWRRVSQHGAPPDLNIDFVFTRITSVSGTSLSSRRTFLVCAGGGDTGHTTVPRAGSNISIHRINLPGTWCHTATADGIIPSCPLFLLSGLCERTGLRHVARCIARRRVPISLLSRMECRKGRIQLGPPPTARNVKCCSARPLNTIVHFFRDDNCWRSIHTDHPSCHSVAAQLPHKH